MTQLTIKNLDKAQKIYADIQKIDSDILKIEKLANEILSDDCSMEIAIYLTNNSKLIKKEEKPFDSVINWLMPEVEKRENAKLNSFHFSDREVLVMFQSIIAIKNNSRRLLLLELEKLGIKI